MMITERDQMTFSANRRRATLWTLALIVLWLTQGCTGRTALPLPTPTEPPSATVPLATAAPSSTPSPSRTPTSTPAPTPTPTPTPHPDTLEWLNPFTHQRQSLPATCYAPGAQALIHLAAENPQGVVQAWIEYWDDYFQEHPDLMEQAHFSPTWYRWFFEAPHAYGVVVDLGASPFGSMPFVPGKAGDVYIRFPTLLLGLADAHEYPDLGLTVFTACALIYDNDLATRAYSLEELEAMPTDEVVELGKGKLLMRPDPENAQPRWYLGEVAVAYAIHPDSWLNDVETAGGEVLIEDPATGEYRSIAVNLTIAPGCYYLPWPKAIRRAKGHDPDCSLLDDLSQAMGTYVGWTVLEDHAAALLDTLTLHVEQLASSPSEVGLYHDFYAKPRESMSREAWKSAIHNLLFDQAPLTSDPILIQSQGVARTLSLITLAWKEAQPDPGAPLCTAQRALFHYKLKPDIVTPYCSMEEVMGKDYWIPMRKVYLFDGEPFLLSIESLLTGEK